VVELHREPQNQRSSTRWQSRVLRLVSCVSDLLVAHSRLDGYGLTELAWPRPAPSNRATSVAWGPPVLFPAIAKTPHDQDEGRQHHDAFSNHAYGLFGVPGGVVHVR
jgi:hypothetical protein